MTRRNAGAGFVAKLYKSSVALIAENQARIARRILCVHALQFGSHRSGHNEDVRITIVVQIRESRTPANKAPFCTQARPQSHVVEFAFAIVVVETRSLMHKVGLQHIKMPIEIIISNPDAHASHQVAVAAHGHSAHQTLFAESAVMIIQQQQTWGLVTGHKDVLPAVFIGVEGHRRKSVRTAQRPNPRLLRNVRKGAVAVIAVERVGGESEPARAAICRHTFEAAIRHVQ